MTPRRPVGLALVWLLRCDHPVKDCRTVEGESCVGCHHDASLTRPMRRTSGSLGPRQYGPERSALLREIRQRRGRPN
jgi:hypothetical protein